MVGVRVQKGLRTVRYYIDTVPAERNTVGISVIVLDDGDDHKDGKRCEGPVIRGLGFSSLHRDVVSNSYILQPGAPRRSLSSS